MVKNIHIDARNNPKLERQAFSLAMGVEPLPDQLESALETDTTPKQFLQGHSSAPRFVAVKKLPPWREAEAKFMVSHKEEDAKKVLSAIRSRKKEIYQEKSALVAELKTLGTQLEMQTLFQSWIEWAQHPEKFQLEAPQVSVWHKVREAFHAGHIMHGALSDGGVPEAVGAEFKPFFSDEPQVFLVEHDWASAFATAEDFSSGEYPLPFSNCAFEFKINGRRLLCLIRDDRLAIVSELGRGAWCCSAWTSFAEIEEHVRYAKVTKNIRAICIALDAEVAETSVVRAPHRLNLAREKQGKKPINDYHVINLTKRSRVEALPASEHEPRWHPRLHFRRGHWRHFTDHKTWIKWMLVGDPDLGFIDKEYRA